MDYGGVKGRVFAGMVVWLKDSAQFGGVKVGRYFTGFGMFGFGTLVWGSP